MAEKSGMKKEINLSAAAGVLRQRVDKTFKEKHSRKEVVLSATNTVRRLQKLEQQQIKLELQKEELNATIRSVETATDKFRNFYLSASAGFFTLDSNCNICELNISGASMLGKERVKLINHNFDLFVTPDNRACFHLFFKKILSTSNKQTCEVKITKKNKDPMVVLMEGIYSGTDRLCLLTVIDVTESKQPGNEIIKVKENAAISRREYQSTFDNLLVGVVVHDPNTHIVFSNHEASNILGLTSRQMVGKDAIDPVWMFVYEDMSPMKIEDYPVNKVVSTKRPLTNYVAGIIRSDRDYVTWANINAMPIFHNDDDKNDLEKVVINFVDITQRIKMDEALRKSETHLSNIINSIGHPVFVKDDQSRLLIVNDAFCKLFNRTKAQVIGKTLAEEVSALEREHFLRIDKQVLNTGDDNITEEFITVRGGPSLTISTRKTRYIDSTGTKFLIGLIFDITETKMQVEEIERSREELTLLAAHLQTVREEERTRIAREIHDELGQQLTCLKMDASWINKKLVTKEKAIAEKLKSILLSIDEMVISVRRIAGDLRPGILDDLGLIDALDWQCNEFQQRTGKSCQFTTALTEIDLDDEIVTGIFRLYQEALTNIARHAKATQVKTSLVKNNKYLTLTIQDNGKGFDTKEMKNKKTLGLVGMKERVVRMGGELLIQSEIGKGTTIVSKVPIVCSIIK